jgi:hypothetical protein
LELIPIMCCVTSSLAVALRQRNRERGRQPGRSREATPKAAPLHGLGHFGPSSRPRPDDRGTPGPMVLLVDESAACAGKEAKAMKSEEGDWVHYRARFGLSDADEINFHFGKLDHSEGTYDEAMAKIEQLVWGSLSKAQLDERPYLMFVHGHSTSHQGRTTTRSIVRGIMRSKEATPYIVRAHCIQHRTVFITKVRTGNSNPQ